MRIAIIGGIGSGKSTVLEAIKELGFSVRSADEINRELLDDPQYIRLLRAAFPDVIVDGKLDKDSLRSQIYSDPSKRHILNSIAHPLIRRKVATYDDKPLIVEVPLIVESSMHADFDELILVRSKVSKRVKRLKQRTMMKSLVRKVMLAQVSEKKLMQYATITIDNNGTIEELKQSVKEVMNYIMSENERAKSKKAAENAKVADTNTIVETKAANSINIKSTVAKDCDTENIVKSEA